MTNPIDLFPRLEQSEYLDALALDLVELGNIWRIELKCVKKPHLIDAVLRMAKLSDF
jgi:hypothetical protein